MKRRSQQGMALVITLIMLAVVTVMAVSFLAISRSQKASVTVVQDQVDARLMADSALARAQAAVIGRMLAFTNPYATDFFVSTNLIDPLGFDPNILSRANVAYHDRGGGPLTADELRAMLSRLQYDARAPVFVPVPTNVVGDRIDFRYYLDFNRNGRFETNGWQPVLDQNGFPLRLTSGPLAGTTASNFFVGDPEWIGVLERPDLPHSGSNRFIGRYAFLALPAGKSLDLNFVHNHAKGTVATEDGYYRNQGIGSWELNLAAFLCDLNTNVWPNREYAYDTRVVQRSSGQTFRDAYGLLSYRYASNHMRLRTLEAALTPRAAQVFASDGTDQHADGPLMTGRQLEPTDADRGEKAWAGSDNPQSYFDAQEMFDLGRVRWMFNDASTGIPQQLRNARNSYDRYTFYRLLSQMGTDSAPPVRKLHLNYNNLSQAVSNVVPWTPVEFFTNAADLILRSQMARVVQGGVTNYVMGGTRVRATFGVGDIMVYPTNEYSAEVHRALQLAANVYDATTNRTETAFPHLPSVFRPRFKRVGDAVYIAGYAEVTNSAPLNAAVPWRDVQLPGDRGRLAADDHVFGVPWVVGAKKGLPNFNEFMVQTLAQVTRKLEVRKRNPNAAPTPANFVTNQMYLMSISNLFGFEAWNSYTQAYPRPLRIEARVQTEMLLGTTNRVVWPAAGGLFRDARAIAPLRLAAGSWFGGQLRVPFFTNTLFLPESILLHNPPRFRPAAPSPVFDATPGFPIVDLDFRMTNRIQFFVIDEAVDRVVDFVNLATLSTGFNFTTNLMGSGSTGPGRDHIESGGGRSALTDSSFWVTNRMGGPQAVTVGVSNQVFVAMNNVLSPEQWRDASGDPRSGQDVQKAIEGFRRFLGFPDATGRLDPDRSVAKEVPFSPTRRFFQETKWQANDPLVHYHRTDLASPDMTLLSFLKPAQRVVTNSNLGLLNDRYFPWGGNTNKTPQALDYDLSIKDPLVLRPDDWNFPTNKFPNIGWLGRVHRGTPWQTVYLKSPQHDLRSWVRWSGSAGTHPTNDWILMDLFTVAPNDNASRGLMSVNQTNIAAWSALLSGVPVLSNTVPADRARRGVAPAYASHVIQPNSPQLRLIVQNVIETQRTRQNGVFRGLGDILSVPALTVASPFLSTNVNQVQHALTDDVIERIPQQVMSLMKADDPRVVVYAYGQSLRPAPNSVVVAPGPYFQLCTNYQITGETAVKAVIRFDNAPESPRAVIESYNVIPAE